MTTSTQERLSAMDNVKVYITHLRVPTPPEDVAMLDVRLLYTSHEIRKAGYGIAAKGGVTFAQLEFSDGRTFLGWAKCSPRDNYCKATGRMIAIGRAIKSADRVG